MPTPATPQIDAEAYRLFQEHGKSYPDGAAAMDGCNVHTFRSRVGRHQARIEKAQALGPDGIEAIGEAGADLSHVRMAWLKTDKVSVRVDFPTSDGVDWDARVGELCEQIASVAPKPEPAEYHLGDHLLWLCPADIHMGKLAEVIETGERYDIAKAEEATRIGVSGVLQMAQRFSLEQIIVNTGNDGLHVDNHKRTTTSGTPQDVCASYWAMCDAMFWTWVWIIEEARKIAPVRVVFDPSNHPWLSDWQINKQLAAYFRSTPGVTFDPMMQAPIHRKYIVYGSSLIGTSHGDGAAEKDLDKLMQHEARSHWGQAMRGYWIVKHLHHKRRKTVGLSPDLHEKDHIGVTTIRYGGEDLSKNVAVEVVRSPSASDGWHHRNGFVGAVKAIEAYLFHHSQGQVARFTRPLWQV